MPDLEKMGYYVIIATAGHDTTSAAMTEGMDALRRIRTSSPCCATTRS